MDTSFLSPPSLLHFLIRQNGSFLNGSNPNPSAIMGPHPMSMLAMLLHVPPRAIDKQNVKVLMGPLSPDEPGASLAPFACTSGQSC